MPLPIRSIRKDEETIYPYGDFGEAHINYQINSTLEALTKVLLSKTQIK